MHIGVEEPVADGMFEEGADDVQPKRAAVEAGRLDGREIGQRDGLDPVQGHDALRGPLPIDLRNAEILVARFLDVFGHLRDGGRFKPQIHFQQHRLRERVDRGHRAQPPR